MAPVRTDLDVAAALENALQEKLEFNGSISFHETYPDAPNPGLVLSDLGTIGLPLNPREAQVIKTRAEQAPFGMGERTVIDTLVRDTWQMDANMVKLENPTWTVWLNRIVQEVCRTLGVNYGASKPRCELYKLLLYETGSHFLPHVDTEKADGMFATIVVVLPSKFAGGAAHLSHGSMSAVYDCSATSDFQTSVMAWYTDVTHEIKPITNGYRLALSYNLVHTTTALRPALSGNEKAIGALSEALRAWKADAGSNAPIKILYLLTHKYSQANLCGSALKASDAQHTALLDMLGKQLGFCLGLASVECRVAGAADDEYGYNRRDRWCSDEEDSEYEDKDDRLSFAEIEDQSMSITNFVDLNGKKIRAKLEVDDGTETIPAELEESVISGVHDKQEYEGYMGNGAGGLERWYRRTVLVIWPSYANCLMTGNVKVGCIELTDGVNSTKAPTPELRTRVEFLLGRFGNTEHVVNVANAVCHAACKWSDVKLWKRAVDICSTHSGLAILAVDDICYAIKVFGFDAVKLSLDAMVQRESHNKQLFDFLDKLRIFNWEKLDEDERDAEESHGTDETVDAQVVAAWTKQHQATALKALRKLTKDDFAVLIQLALGNGGLAYIRDSILPQIATSADPAVLKEFATYVVKDQGFSADSEASLKQALVSQILQAAISQLTIKPTALPANSYWSYTRPEPLQTDPSLDLAKSYFEACLALQCSDLAGSVVRKVADTSEQSTTDVQRRTTVLMVPFLTYIVDYSAQHPGTAAGAELAVLQKAVVTSIVDSMVANPHSISRQEVTKLFQTVSIQGGRDRFARSILPRLNNLTATEVSAKAFLEEIHSRSNRISLSASYKGPLLTELIASLAKKYAKLANIATCETIITAIDCCIRVQALDSVWVVLNRVLDPGTLKKQVYFAYSAREPRGGPGTYADRVVAPLVEQLRKLALKHNMLDALSPAFRMIIRTFMQNLLGSLPAADPTNMLTAIGRWTCGCHECTSVRAFLLSSPLQTLSFVRIGAPKRKHVEAFLSQHVREGATWETISRRPQGIRVTKTVLLCDYALWKVNQKTAVQLLKDVSPDEAERKRILGDEYAEFVRWAKGVSAAAAIAMLQQAPAASASSSTATSGTTGVRRPAPAGQVLPPAKRRKTAGR